MKKGKVKKYDQLGYDIVEVIWQDAISGFQEPLTPSEIERQLPAPTKSVGYLIYEDNEKVILGFMLFDFKYCKHWQLIPRGMIKDIRLIEGTEKIVVFEHKETKKEKKK